MRLRYFDNRIAIHDGRGDFVGDSRNVAVFETMPVPGAVRNMAVPTVIGQLIVLFYNMADTFFVGQTNNPYMVAGASLILPVFNISLALAGLAGVGGGALISRLLGKGEIQEARRVGRFSIRMAFGLAGLFSLAMLFFRRPILTFLGAGNDTYRYANQYAFCVIVLGGLPTVLSNTYANLLRSIGESRKAGVGITLGGLLNVALDPLFMFVLLPKGSEILGAGLATCLSNVISCSYFLITIHGLGPDSVLRNNSVKEFPAKENLKSIFNVGIPSALATFLFDFDYIVIGRLMTAYGDIQMAAIGIVLKIERLPLNIGVGICQGMMPIVAYNYASGNRKRMRDTIAFSCRVGLICAAISIALYEIFALNITGLFIGDAQTVALGTDFLRIRCLATPFMFLSFFTVYLFNGFGKGRTALFLGVMRWLILNIPMLYILSGIFGMYGIVWSQIVADVINVGISMYVYRRFERGDGGEEN